MQKTAFSELPLSDQGRAFPEQGWNQSPLPGSFSGQKEDGEKTLTPA